MSGPDQPLHGGGSVALLAPTPGMVRLDAVALGLSRIARFNGQTWRRVTVLEHSCQLALAVRPGLMLPALLHDAHEHATGDLTRSLRAALAAREPGFGPALARIAAEIDAALAGAALPCAGAARRLAAAFGDAELMGADDFASELEMLLFVDGDAGGLSRMRARGRAGAWGPAEPDAGRLADAWLGAVVLLSPHWTCADDPERGCEADFASLAAAGLLRRALLCGDMDADRTGEGAGGPAESPRSNARRD